MPYGMQQTSQDEGQLHHALVLYVVDPILFRDGKKCKICVCGLPFVNILLHEIYMSLPVFG